MGGFSNHRRISRKSSKLMPAVIVWCYYHAYRGVTDWKTSQESVACMFSWVISIRPNVKESPSTLEKFHKTGPPTNTAWSGSSLKYCLLYDVFLHSKMNVVLCTEATRSMYTEPPPKKHLQKIARSLMDHSLIEGFSLGWVIMRTLFGEDNLVGVFAAFRTKAMETKTPPTRVRNPIAAMSEHQAASASHPNNTSSHTIVSLDVHKK